MSDARTTLAALGEAIEAARPLGLDTARAEAVQREASDRLGLVPDAYVLALVGGTGVGKSSLLNALAGQTISAAGVRRPTTSRPVAWVANADVGEVRPLLAHLDVDVSTASVSGGTPGLVLLDLPDIDSVEPEHRAWVEAVLPKVDVVAWVTDPEKYADAVLHDAFLRTWIKRLDRQVVILNKVDRLDTAARRSVVADLRRLLAAELRGRGTSQGAAPIVIETTATAGEAGIAELRAWLDGATDAKAIVAGRLAAAGRAAVAELAGAAGLGDAPTSASELLGPADRRRATRRATEEVLRVVDLAGVERRAVAATRARARRRGTGPIGLLTSTIYRATGRQARVADPGRYLREWRTRGALTPAAEAVRTAVIGILPQVPLALRPGYAGTTQGLGVEGRLATAVSATIARQPELEPPSSRLWPVLGALQTINTLFLAFAAAWLVVWLIARPAVSSFDVPLLGMVPAPFALLAIALLLGYVLARVLSLHAGWAGRRWARSLATRLRDEVTEAIDEGAFAPVAALERSRSALAAAWAAVR